MMKKITLLASLIFCFVSTISFGQFDKLSTFEEMWIVSPKFDGVDGESLLLKKGFGKAMEFKSFTKPAKHSGEGLYKIIADTPFLSIEIDGRNTKESKIERKESPSLILTKNSANPKGEASAELIIIKSGEKYFLLIPMAVPDVLVKLIAENGLVLDCEFLNMKQMDIGSMPMKTIHSK